MHASHAHSFEGGAAPPLPPSLLLLSSLLAASSPFPSPEEAAAATGGSAAMGLKAYRRRSSALYSPVTFPVKVKSPLLSEPVPVTLSSEPKVGPRWKVSPIEDEDHDESQRGTYATAALFDEAAASSSSPSVVLDSLSSVVAPMWAVSAQSSSKSLAGTA